MHPRTPDTIRHPNTSTARASTSRVRRILLATLSASLLSMGQAIAEDAPETAPPQASNEQAAATPKPGRNGKICQVEEVTGSLMKKRVCKTPEQWAARENAAKRAVREMDQRPVEQIFERPPGG